MKKLSEQEKRRRTYEKANRRKKINDATKEIDETVYNFLASASKEWWNKLFLDVNHPPPSDKSVDEILDRYFRRVKRR